MIQKHEIPILEYDSDSAEVIRPDHGAEQLVLPEKCVFGFLGDVIDDYARETNAVIAEHFETITKSYPIYIVRQNPFSEVHYMDNRRFFPGNTRYGNIS